MGCARKLPYSPLILPLSHFIVRRPKSCSMQNWSTSIAISFICRLVLLSRHVSGVEGLFKWRYILGSKGKMKRS